MTLTFNNKVVIPVGEYQNLRGAYNDFSKILGVKSYINDSYLREVDEEKLLDCKGEIGMYGLYQIMYYTLIDIRNTLISPFFIIILLIIYYQYYQMGKQVNSLSNKKYSPLANTINSAIYGIFGGFITTIAFIYLEVVVIPKDFMYILFVAIFLSLINPRFMCFAYGGSIVSLACIIIGFPKVDTKDIMLIVATLHIVESILIFINGNNGNIPTYFQRDGDFVGGFNMNRFWPIPFVIFVGDGLIKPITLMAILSYGDFTLSYPKKKTIYTSLELLFYSSLLLVSVKVFSNPIIPPIFAIIGHEFLIYINKFKEKTRVPVFTTSHNGVRVLEVSKNSIGKKLGIDIGDIIISINEVVVRSEKDINEIESLGNAVIKIKYFNKRKGILTKTYEGKRKTLGISVVPRVLY